MNVRSIALQGIGFGVAMTALQGFAVVAVVLRQTPGTHYSEDEDEDNWDRRRRFITRQNHTLLHLLAAFIVTGEI